MLSSQHFYHRIIRKMVVAFGTIFNDIKLVRYNKAGTTEIERITVPLVYSQKEKFYQRITADPGLNRTVEIVLPRMSFELDAISYDPLRKISSFNQSFTQNSSTKVNYYTSTPYNFEFSLNIYVRNVEDGTQIVEQILPYFNPDMTLTGDFIGEGLNVDLPVVLQSVNYSVDNEGSPETLRMIIWTLTFTMKGFMFGPVANSSVIRKATANTYDSTFNYTGQNKITVSSGSGTYKVNELVYEGKSLTAANASGFVKSWSPSTNTLVIVDTNGVIQTGKMLYGAVSNAAYNISSIGQVTGQMVEIEVTPNPSSANANDAFGFDTTITEFPNIT